MKKEESIPNKACRRQEGISVSRLSLPIDVSLIQSGDSRVSERRIFRRRGGDVAGKGIGTCSHRQDNQKPIGRISYEHLRRR